MTNQKERKAILMDLTEEQLAQGVAHYIAPFIKEQINSILSQKKEDESKPLSMADAADWLTISRTLFSKYVGEGRIPYTSRNRDNPKEKKYFQISDLREWLEQNKSKTIVQLKNASDGKL